MAVVLNHRMSPNASLTVNKTLENLEGKHDLTETIAISVIIIAIVIITILGNLLVCTAIFLERSVQRVQNWFIASLAISDLTVGLVIMPPALVYELMGYWYFGRALCEVFLALDVFACTASILNLCMISVDRYWSVTQAVQYFKNTNSRRAGCMIAAAWVLSAVISLPPLFGLFGWQAQVPNGSERYPQCEYSDSPGYVLYSTIGSFYIPLAVVLVMNARIFRIALKRVKKNNSSSPTATNFKQKPEAGSVNIALKSILKKSVSKGETHPNVQESPDFKKSCTKETDVPQDEECSSGHQKNGEVVRENGVVISAESDSVVRENGVVISGDSDSSTRRVRRVKVGPVYVEEITCQEVGDCPPDVDADFQTGFGVDATSVGLDFANGTAEEPRPDRIRRKLRQSRERRLTVVIGIVMGVFVVCWVPFFVSYVVSTVCRTCFVDPSLFRVFVWLGYCNSALNPVIYTVFNRDFRKAFRKVIFGRLLRRSRTEQSSYV